MEGKADELLRAALANARESLRLENGSRDGLQKIAGKLLADAVKAWGCSPTLTAAR